MHVLCNAMVVQFVVCNSQFVFVVISDAKRWLRSEGAGEAASGGRRMTPPPFVWGGAFEVSERASCFFDPVHDCRLPS
jgi:hypothetical protein